MNKVESLNLYDHGLTALAGYNFIESPDTIANVRYNVQNNKDLLAVRKKNDGTQELITIEKTSITCLNRFKALFKRGELANLDYDFHSVATFVTEKVRTISDIARKKIQEEQGQGQSVPFSERVKKFEGDENIVTNIYAIANRFKFSAKFSDDWLFTHVSQTHEEGPRVVVNSLGRKIQKNSFKHNPGMKKRFLTLQAKRLLGIMSFNAQIKKAEEEGYRPKSAAHNQGANTALRDFYSPKSQEVKLNDAVPFEDVGKLILYFKPL